MLTFAEMPRSANPRSPMMLALVLQGIKQGDWNAELGGNRGILVKRDEDELLASRKIFPGVLISGAYQDAEGGDPKRRIFRHTGLMGVTIITKNQDGKTTDEIKTLLASDPHVVACWKSPSGFEVDAIVKIPADAGSHGLSFNAAQHHYLGIGLNLHQSMCHLESMPVSYDPDCWINQGHVVELAPEILEEGAPEFENDDDSTPFPMSCLPGVAGEMATEIARVTTSQNEALAAASVIGILSASLGAGIGFSTGGERWTRGNLYLMPVAMSGTGKGEAFALAAVPFIAAETEAIDSFNRNQRPNLTADLNVVASRVKLLTTKAAKESDTEVKAGLIADLQSAERTKVELERQIASAPRYKVGDVTKERLAVLMQGQVGEALASMSSEARGVLGVVQGRYSGGVGDEDFYCSAYSGDEVTFDRIGRDTVILKKPCLTINWMIQPDVIEASLGKSSMTESGLMPRFLMFDANAEPKVRNSPPAPIRADTKQAWAKLISSIVATYRIQTLPPYSLTATPDALRMLTEYENGNIKRRQSTGDLRDIAPYVARWSENASKLALVLHCAQHGDQAHLKALDRDSADRAVQLMRWFADRQLSLLTSGMHESLTKRCACLMDILGLGDKKIRELERSHGFKKGEIERIHAQFPKFFNIVKHQAPGGGRPSDVATIFRSPSTLEAFKRLQH